MPQPQLLAVLATIWASGAGAHSKLSFAFTVVRQVRWRDPGAVHGSGFVLAGLNRTTRWLAPIFRFEFMLNALRLRHGFGLRDFSERTGSPLGH